MINSSSLKLLLNAIHDIVKKPRRENAFKSVLLFHLDFMGKPFFFSTTLLHLGCLTFCFVLLFCILTGIKKTSETQEINAEILLQVPNAKDIRINMLAELDLTEVMDSRVGDSKPNTNYKCPILNLPG